jgi:hypothetical protein
MKAKCKIKDFAKSIHGNRVLSLDILSGMNEQELNELNDRDLSIDIKQWRERRSLDANAYFWVLCDRLSEVTGRGKSEIYRDEIRDIGGNSETVCVMDKAVDKLRSAWEKNGLGWQTETFDSKLDGCTNVTLYYGSSAYDKAQMARLIDNVVQDCKAVGIETMTPDQLDRLKEEWS